VGVTDVETEFRRLGPYLLLRASGAGGMARIDLALRGGPEAAEVCVLKRLHADYRSPEQEARFRREAAIARRLSHDAIARTLGIDEVEGELLLLQELVMGVDLRRLTARVAAIGERLPVPLAVHVVSEVARALDYAHEFRKLGIVHRDVTPDNIMLAFSGAVKLVDFGIARSNADATLTQAGFVVGRPIYTAPEVWTGARADRRSDIYSLGVVLWQLLTGRPLEPGDATSSPTQINPEVPPALGAVNLRAFDADPAKRYPSAGELHRALATHLPTSFGAREQLSGLLARHFDIAREGRMLAEDVARAKPLLAVGKRQDSARPAATRRNKLLLAAALGLLLLNGALIRFSPRRTAAPPPRATPTPSTIPAPRVTPTPSTIPAPRATPTPSTIPAPRATISTSSTSRPAAAPAARAAAPRTALNPTSDPAAGNTTALRQPRTRAHASPDAAHPASSPVSAEKLLADAQQHFDRGDLPGALTLARDAAHHGAGGPAYILIGTIMMNQRHYDDAEQAFAEAARSDPKDARAARLLAMVREIRKMGEGRQ
jgi:serine/threonine protein kinase